MDSSNEDLFIYCHYRVHVVDKTYNHHVLLRDNDLYGSDGTRLDYSYFAESTGRRNEDVVIYQLVSERPVVVNNEKVMAPGMPEPLYIISRGLALDGESVVKRIKRNVRLTIQSSNKSNESCRR